MGHFKDYGTDEWDDIMVRELPNIERIVDSVRYVLEQARDRFAPGDPFLEQIREQ